MRLVTSIIHVSGKVCHPLQQVIHGSLKNPRADKTPLASLLAILKKRMVGVYGCVYIATAWTHPLAQAVRTLIEGQV